MSVVYLRMAYPPQANHIFTVARGRKIMSSRYRTWRSFAASEIALQKPAKILGAFNVKIIFERPDRRKRDLDNLAKPCLDALKEAGVIEDDSLATEINLTWSNKEPGKDAITHVWLNFPDE